MNDELLPAEDAKKNSRKRKRNVKSWKLNIRKEKREHGKEYCNTKGKVMKRRDVRNETCRPNCCFKCTEKITEVDRKLIHRQFWQLSDSKKPHFFSKYVKNVKPSRKRTKAENSGKQNVFQYYFEISSDTTRVCKEFFCNTLDISQQRVYYFFKQIQNQVTNVPRSPKKGKNTKRITLPEKIQEIRNHIQSFPTVDSHYCRANSQKQYLEATLIISKMYDLYRVKHDNPVSHCIYSKVFNREFNLSFFRPKKDLCDKCESFKVLTNPSDNDKILHNEHLKKR